ncbi:MAG: twin-arginine translocation signal domain-containing protein, partial [Lachnospiraceae bacterium]|nr:twin-arginine translocation signal domain-containing protein [Lachnospiraceae bacterium]
MMRRISRRDFLKGTAASAASLAVSTLFLDRTSGLALAAEDEAVQAVEGVEATSKINTTPCVCGRISDNREGYTDV